MGTIIFFFVLLIIVLTILDGINRGKRRQLAWDKIRFIQKTTPSNKKKIFITNDKCCSVCGSTEKLCFNIDKEDSSKFRLRDVSIVCSECNGYSNNYYYSRKVPEHTKKLVYGRDYGVCTNCGSAYKLEYDHIIPFSYGGASADANNIQLLCRSCSSRKRASFRY